MKDSENGKAISEIRIRNGETMTVQKRSTPGVPQVNLVNSDGTLNPLARRAFTEWFEKFSTDNKMSPDQCAGFINSCTSIKPLTS